MAASSNAFIDIMDTILPAIGGYQVMVYLLVFVACGLAIVGAYLYSQKRSKIKVYRATIFERAGTGGFRKTIGKVIYDVASRTFKLAGGTEALTLSFDDAYPNDKGRLEFELLNTGENIVPLTINSKVKDESGKEVEISELDGKLNMRAIRMAGIEAIKEDSKKFKFIDQYLPYLMLGTQIVSIIAVLLLTFILYGKISQNTDVMQEYTVAVQKATPAWQSIANDFHVIASECKAVAAPPPG